MVHYFAAVRKIYNNLLNIVLINMDHTKKSPNDLNNSRKELRRILVNM